MKKILTTSVILAAALTMTACERESVDKADDARQHTEQARDKIESAQKQLDAAQDEKAEAAKDHAAAKEAKAEEDRTFVPTSQLPEGTAPQTPEK